MWVKQTIHENDLLLCGANNGHQRILDYNFYAPFQGRLQKPLTKSSPP
jgi:hypothetical protein